MSYTDRTALNNQLGSSGIFSPREHMASSQLQECSSPTLRQTIMSYFGRGIEQINRLRSPQREEDPTFEFRAYLDTISEELQALSRLRRNQQKAKIMAIQKVENCYKTIPKQFFEEGYDIKSMPQRKRVKQHQEQLGDHLDMVEITLFSQINANFGQYLGLMSAMDDLEELVQKGIQKIVINRTTLARLKQLFLKQADKVSRMVQRQNSLQRTLEVLAIARKLTSIPENLRSLMKGQQWNFSVLQAVVDSKNDTDLVGKLACISRFGGEINLVHEEARQYLKQQIQLKSAQLLEGCFFYDKEKWLADGLPKNAIAGDEMDRSLNMDVTVLDQSYLHSERQSEHQPAQEKLQRIAEELADVASFAAKLGQLEGCICESVMQKLQRFDAQFFKDLRQYLHFLLERSGKLPRSADLTMQQLTQPLQVQFYVKIVLVYFSIVKRVVLRVNSLIELAQNQDFYQKLQKSISDFIVARIRSFLALKKVASNTDYNTFMKYISIIDYWIEEEEELVYYNIRSLAQTKDQLIDLYITNMHKETLTRQLKQALETDNFNSVSIPSDYYQQLEFLFNYGSLQESVGNACDVTLNFSMRRDRKQRPAELQDTTTTSNVRVLHKVLCINNNNYQVSQSFLLLLQILQEYVQMSAVMTDHCRNLQQKIMELIGFYNWYLKELLLNAGVLKFQPGIRSVQIKQLCLAVHLVELLQLLLPKMPVEKQQLRIKQQTAVKAHHTELLKKIPTVLVYLLEGEVAGLYECRIGPKNPIPTEYSKNITTLLRNACQSLSEFFQADRTKELLSMPIKMLSKNYFTYLASVGKRGFQELDWFLDELDRCFSDYFERESSQMRQELRKRRR